MRVRTMTHEFESDVDILTYGHILFGCVRLRSGASHFRIFYFLGLLCHHLLVSSSSQASKEASRQARKVIKRTATTTTTTCYRQGWWFPQDEQCFDRFGVNASTTAPREPPQTEEPFSQQVRLQRSCYHLIKNS